MDTTLILDAENDGVIEILSNTSTMRTWEFVRGTGGVCTIAELVDATDLGRAIVQEQADALVTLGLLQKVRARKPRRVPGYRSTCERIILAFDEHDPKIVARMFEVNRTVDADHARSVEKHADLEFQSTAGFRFQIFAALHLTTDELAELRRRVMSVVTFIQAARPSVGRVESRGDPDEAEMVAPRYCNQSINIRLDPLVGKLLPSPNIITSPRSRLDRWDDSNTDAAGLPSLAPRERQVALALADGLTRAKVADRLGLSVHTVSTLARRLYRKLGVSSQAELTARLSGHDREVPGDS